jgi:hypothetical protein
MHIRPNVVRRIAYMQRVDIFTPTVQAPAQDELAARLERRDRLYLDTFSVAAAVVEAVKPPAKKFNPIPADIIVHQACAMPLQINRGICRSGGHQWELASSRR